MVNYIKVCIFAMTNKCVTSLVYIDQTKYVQFTIHMEIHSFVRPQCWCSIFDFVFHFDRKLVVWLVRMVRISLLFCYSKIIIFKLSMYTEQPQKNKRKTHDHDGENDGARYSEKQNIKV